MKPQPFAEKCLNSFQEEEIGEIYLAYTHFKNTVSHEPKLIRLLPVEVDETEADEESNVLELRAKSMRRL